MDKQTTSWVSYITFIGWIIAYCAGDKDGAKFYLNQSLIIWLFLVGVIVLSPIIFFIPIIGALAVWAAEIFIFIVWIIGLISAIKQEEKEIPLIGNIKILK